MRQRGWTKIDDTRIARMERLRRRDRCFLEIDAFTLCPYCGTHGQEWPCPHTPASQLTMWPGVRADTITDRLRPSS